MIGGEFLEPETMYPIMAWRFPVWYILLSFSVNWCIFPLSDPLRVLLVILWYRLSIQPFRYVVWLTYFSTKLLGFFCISLLICFLVIPSQLLIKFFFRCFVPFCLYCFTLSRYIFNLASFASSFWYFFLKLYCKFFMWCLFLSVPNYSIVFPLFYLYVLFS